MMKLDFETKKKKILFHIFFLVTYLFISIFSSKTDNFFFHSVFVPYVLTFFLLFSSFLLLIGLMAVLFIWCENPHLSSSNWWLFHCFFVIVTLSLSLFHFAPVDNYVMREWWFSLWLYKKHIYLIFFFGRANLTNTIENEFLNHHGFGFGFWVQFLLPPQTFCLEFCFVAFVFFSSPKDLIWSLVLILVQFRLINWLLLVF